MKLKQRIERAQKIKPLRLGVLLGTAVIIISGVVLVVAAYDGASLGLGPRTDRATAVTVALTMVGVLIAVVAALVALAAYWSASGEADLSVEVRFEYGTAVNDVRLQVLPPREIDRWIPLKEYKQLSGSVVLRNSSKYAAKNPSVVIKFEGMSGPPGGMTGWEITTYANMVGPTEFTWDGGADRMVHGLGIRKLPEINLFGACILPDAVPKIIVTAYADGLKPVSLPLRVATWTTGTPGVPETQS